MRLIFCGTPQFAVPTLERLISAGFDISLVVTNPDEPSGRGYELKSPPVKQFASEAGLPVFQPASLKEPLSELSVLQPDAIVVVAYGHIIFPWMIALPRLGCLNLHASLLPRYRGAAPIAWAIMRGERITGVTVMQIDRGLDTGDILSRKEVEVREDETTETLSGRLSGVGSELMVQTLGELDRGQIHPQPQNERLATYAPMLRKEDGRLDWSLAAEELAWRVRGLRPWPVAHTSFRGRNMRLWAAQPLSEPLAAHLSSGALVADQGRLTAGCGGGTRLELVELQIEGRKRMSARDFLNGISLAPDERLGE
ncbi:MAG: methionyl-tRNA formyltransferase [Terriglobia bacterium]